jgi:hypothetical protein
MASADWAFMTGGLDGASVRRGVTNGIARPNGGGNFVYGFNSVVNTAGAVALYTAQTNFAPMSKGGQVTAAVQRGPSGGPLNFAPFVYLCAQTNDVSAAAYLLGLDDDDPHKIVLRKGKISDGLPALPAGNSGVLLVGTETFVAGTWKHLRLDAVVNTNGDVILKAFESDLGANAVTSPVWTPVPGVEEFIDDALGVNSGSVPFLSGYGGFAFVTKDITRRSYFDQLTVERQL